MSTGETSASPKFERVGPKARFPPTSWIKLSTKGSLLLDLALAGLCFGNHKLAKHAGNDLVASWRLNRRALTHSQSAIC